MNKTFRVTSLPNVPSMAAAGQSAAYVRAEAARWSALNRSIGLKLD